MLSALSTFSTQHGGVSSSGADDGEPVEEDSCPRGGGGSVVSSFTSVPRRDDVGLRASWPDLPPPR